MAVGVLLAALLLAACGFPRPDRVGDDTAHDAAVDAEIPPGISIRVAGVGDDSNDGITQPVKTLKHAIGLAAANPAITSIVLATGRYATDGGETFPYTVPANLAILGPAGGGAILAGSMTELGMILNDGTLRDLELESFTVAVTAMGNVHLSNVHIRTGATAVRAESSAKLAVDNLDIAGTPGACALGLELHGAAELMATTLGTSALRTTVDARDQSVVSVSHATITGDSNWSALRAAVFLASTSRILTVSDSSIDGGDNGIDFVGTQAPTQATIQNTVIRNTKEWSITGARFVLEMRGGELSSGSDAFSLSDATAKFVGVTVKQHRGFAMEIYNGQKLTLRNCMFLGNGGGVYLLGNALIDAGVVGDPGNNIFQNGVGTAGIDVDAGITGSHISAVGNTWRPSVQGADGDGHYAPGAMSGPLGYSGQVNFNVPATGSIEL